MQSKSNSALKTSIEILDAACKRISPIPEVMPHAPSANNTSARKTIKYFMKCTWFSGTGMPPDEANSIIIPARSVRTLPNITTTADTVTPTDRFMPHPAKVLPRSIHYCSQPLIELGLQKSAVRRAEQENSMPINIRGLAPLLQVFDMPTSVHFYRDVLPCLPLVRSTLEEVVPQAHSFFAIIAREDGRDN
jgi:hypothetical protein